MILMDKVFQMIQTHQGWFSILLVWKIYSDETCFSTINKNLWYLLQ